MEKTPIYIFSTFGSKINEFERKKSEKNEKKSKSLKVAGNYPLWCNQCTITNTTKDICPANQGFGNITDPTGKL